MKKRKILLLLLTLVLAFSMTACKKNQENEDLNEQFVENNENEEQTHTLTPEIIPNVNGIPQDLIDRTEKDFPLTLVNEKTGKNFEIKITSKYLDFFKYVSPKEASPELDLPEDVPLKTNETSVYLYLEEGKADIMEDDGVFVFGAVNENKEDTYFQDARTIYISYYGNPDWVLCGINIGMSEKDVELTIGRPAQEYADETYGKSHEYHMLKDEHTYSLLLNYNKENCVEKITLNIDNHAVY